MRSPRLTGVALALLLALACGKGGERSAPPEKQSTTAPSGTARQGHTPSAWFAGAAPLLLVPGRTPEKPVAVFADTMATAETAGVKGGDATFLALDGQTLAGRVRIGGADACAAVSADSTPPPPGTVGFIGGAPRGLAADPIGELLRDDSLALRRTAYRLASTVPNTASARFSGLPFRLVELWRLHLPDGTTAIVATLKRLINQEDSPFEERTFIIAESLTSVPDDFVLVHAERSVGTEETVESRELLVAFTMRDIAEPMLVVARDFGDETSYSILQRSRTAPHTWSDRWSSRRVRC